MKYFYEFHINKDIQNTIEFSFGMNSFMEHMNGLNELRREKLINKCKIGKKTKMNKAYFPYLIYSDPVKNDIDLSKNIAITGPNASGKTTILKTVLFNLIFSQSFGYGFYSSATITPYNHIHCYLNIPDTSGRDSLFQAEARRCKEIIESLEDGKKHFCIFDELFSGTNPNEACASSYGFIKYLINQKNIDFILTTHLIDLCKKLEPIMENKHMDVTKTDEFNFMYTYQIRSGISNVKGGLKVLFDLRYPEYILDESNKILKEM
jgi:DNA mismatch repair protein MutS